MSTPNPLLGLTAWMAQAGGDMLFSPEDPNEPADERILWFLLACASSEPSLMATYKKFDDWASEKFGDDDLPPIAKEQMFLAMGALLSSGLRWLAETVENGMVDTVYNLRAQEVPWERIAELTGVTKSAAHQRYSSVIRDRTNKIVAKKPKPNVTVRFGRR